MKKLVAFLLTIALAAMVNVTTVSASTVEITTEDKIEYLISQGIPKDFLNNKETQDIDDIYASFYGKTIEYLGTETDQQHLKILIKLSLQIITLLI